MESTSMTKERRTRSNRRREFLKLTGLGTAAAAAATVASVAGADSTEAAETHEATSDGYRATAHVKTFYATARF